MSLTTKQIKFLLLLSLLYLTFALICDPIAYKIISIPFLSIYTIGAGFVFPMLYAFIDIIAELYGENIARFVLFTHIGCDILFTYTILFFIHLPSPHWWEKQSAYNTVFNPMARLNIADILGTVISFLINIRLIVKWKWVYKGKFYIIRAFFASSIGILIYTVITDVLAFKIVPHFIELTIVK